MKISFTNHRVEKNAKGKYYITSEILRDEEAYFEEIGYFIENEKLTNSFIDKDEAEEPLDDEKVFRLYDKEIKNKNLISKAMFLIKEVEKINEIQKKEDVNCINEAKYLNGRNLFYKMKSLEKETTVRIAITEEKPKTKIHLIITNEQMAGIFFLSQLSECCDQKKYMMIKNAFLYHSKDKLKLLYK